MAVTTTLPIFPTRPRVGAIRSPVATPAVKDGQPALGVTDHGNMYGVLDFYKECKKQGINPVIGIEAYMAANSRLERPTRKGKVDDTGGESEGGEKLYYHLTLLAENSPDPQPLPAVGV